MEKIMGAKQKSKYFHSASLATTIFSWVSYQYFEQLTSFVFVKVNVTT